MGVALTVSVLRILRGEIHDCSVVTADTASEPMPLFDEMVALISASPPDGKLIDECVEWLE